MRLEGIISRTVGVSVVDAMDQNFSTKPTLSIHGTFVSHPGQHENISFKIKLFLELVRPKEAKSG